MKVITLCGSTRFRAAFEEWNVRLTLGGAAVFSIAIPSDACGRVWSPEQKAMLGAAHMAKIDISDEIFVLDVGGYIGESTAREIAHAHRAGKQVRYLSEECPEWDERQCAYASMKSR